MAAGAFLAAGTGASALYRLQKSHFLSTEDDPLRSVSADPLSALTDGLQLPELPKYSPETEQAEYRDLQIDSDANNAAASAVAFSSASSAVSQPPEFALLNDQPVINSDEDHLESWRIAEGLVQLLSASQELSPFVLAIDAEWGMGKSSVLGQMCQILKQGKYTPHWKFATFNAWTAENTDALRDIIATVLRQVDPRTARRWVRNLAHNRSLITFLYACGVTLAGFLGFSSSVSNLLTLLSFRERSCNDVRVSVRNVLCDWRQRNGEDCTLVVIIDDLDRCSPETAMQVCEAIKLYLDIPGLIFVLGWNLSALGRSAAAATNDSSVARVLEYLDKIVQLTYRLPVPDRQQIQRLTMRKSSCNSIT